VIKVSIAGLILISEIFTSGIDNIGVDAQVIPYGTLNTTVTGSNNYTVTKGSRVGNNLFHSLR
jgi:hypothetical protein